MRFKHTKNQIIVFDGNEEVGKLTFTHPQERITEILHVFVNPSHRDKGVAKALMEEIVKHAKQNKVLLVPTCSYSAYFFKQHPQYNDILSNTII